MLVLLSHILQAITTQHSPPHKQPARNISGKDGSESEKLKKIKEDMMKQANQSVNPCEDFFEHVCGNWVSDLPKFHLQGMEGFTWNYVRNVHSGLVDAARVGATTNAEHAMVATYNGCVVFMEQGGPSLSAVLKITDVDTQEWLHLPNFSSVAVQFVIRAFLTGVPLFLKVRLVVGTLYLKPGESFTNLFDIDAKSVLKATLEELGLDKGRLLHDLENADLTLGVVKWVKGNFPGRGYEYAGLPEDWDQTLMKQLSGKTSQHVDRVKIDIEDLEGVFQILTAIRKESDIVVRVYTLVSLLAPFLAYDFDRRNLPKGEPDAVHFRCVRVIGELFSDVFPHWVASRLQDPRAAEEAERLALIIMDLAVNLGHHGNETRHQQSELASLRTLHIFGEYGTIGL
ncbi:unnamed protein product [Ixodes hexagonus]